MWLAMWESEVTQRSPYSANASCISSAPAPAAISFHMAFWSSNCAQFSGQLTMWKLLPC